MRKQMDIGFQFKNGQHVLKNVEEVHKQDKEPVCFLKIVVKNVLDNHQKIDIVTQQIVFSMLLMHKYNIYKKGPRKN